MSIYTGFTPDDIVEANPTVVTTGLWSNDTGSYESAFFVNTNTAVSKSPRLRTFKNFSVIFVNVPSQ